MDIICRYGGFEPSCVVITCTMRALKMHGGLPVSDLEGLKAENNAALEKGCENLAKQVENMKLFGIPVVVTINRFAFDRDSEVEGEAVDRDHHGDAEELHVLDLLGEVLATLFEGGVVLGLEPLEVADRQPAVHLKGAHGAGDDHTARLEPAVAADDVHEAGRLPRH